MTAALVERLRAHASQGWIQPARWATLVVAVTLFVTGQVVAAPLLVLLAIGLAGLVLLAVLAVLVGARPDVQRGELPARAHAGETFQVTFTARRRLPALLALEHPTGAGLDAGPLVPAGGGTLTQHMTAVRRGTWQLGPLQIVRQDPAGLLRRRIEVATVPAADVLVWPQTEPVRDEARTRRFDDPPIRPPRPHPARSGTELAGLVAYQPGDDLRRIVWSHYAKHGQLVVREAEQGVTDQLTVALATRRGAHSPGDPSASFEAGVSAAASFALDGLARGMSVTVAGGDGPLDRPGRGPAARRAILDALARVQLGTTSLATTLARIGETGGWMQELIVVTPSLDADELGALSQLVRAGAEVTVVGLTWPGTDVGGLADAARLRCRLIELRPGMRLIDAIAASGSARAYDTSLNHLAGTHR